MGSPISQTSRDAATKNVNSQNRIASTQKTDYRSTTSSRLQNQNSEWRETINSQSKNPQEKSQIQKESIKAQQAKTVWQPPQCTWEQKSASNCNNKDSRKSVCPSDSNSGKYQQLKYEEQITKSAPRFLGDSLMQNHSEKQQTAQRLSHR
ncbi:MAG: hypothetical protein MJZ33_12940 [Paludibacteraceae bacterium]|nr:hypothetical protein [Paludibacteraceae bacterium]